MSERRVPSFVAVTVLEESGFGSRTAAPLIARIFNAIATGTLGEARTADAIKSSFFAENQFGGVEGVTAEGEIDVAALEGEGGELVRNPELETSQNRRTEPAEDPAGEGGSDGQ